MPDSRYLEFIGGPGAPAFITDPDSGLAVPNKQAGAREQVNSITVSVPVPTMVGKDVVEVSRPVEISPSETPDKETGARIIPGTAIVEATHPAVADVLLSTGQYVEVDPPTKSAVNAARKDTTEARVAGKES